MFQRAARLDLADCAERRCLLLTFGIASAVTVRAKDHSNFLFFVKDRTGHVGTDLGLIIRVSNYDQEIGLETFIRFWIGMVVRKQYRYAPCKTKQLKWNSHHVFW